MLAWVGSALVVDGMAAAVADATIPAIVSRRVNFVMTML